MANKAISPIEALIDAGLHTQYLGQLSVLEAGRFTIPQAFRDDPNAVIEPGRKVQVTSVLGVNGCPVLLLEFKEAVE